MVGGVEVSLVEDVATGGLAENSLKWTVNNDSNLTTCYLFDYTY